MTKDSRNKSGKAAEKLAAAHLKKRGYKILKTNLRLKIGEIDILAKHDGALVVVEVKASNDSTDFGPPELRVTAAKQKKLRALALSVIQKYRLTETDIRFDVVSVDYTGGSPDIKVYQSAF